MRKFIEKYAKLNRVAVCNDTNLVAEAVAKELNGEIISIPSGKECLTWIIPDAWKVNKAYIATLDGEKIVDFHDNPMHLFAYSCSFRGILPREELERHLLFDATHPNDIPHHYRYQYAYGAKGWGFCVPYATYKRMHKDKYEVVIDSTFFPGEMKIADCYHKGESEDTILIAAHNCHPAQVNDGLAAVAAGIKLFEYLRKQKTRYSYRLVIGPEFYAAAGFLAKAKGIGKIRYGLYLDILAHDGPIGFSHSFARNSYMDKVVRNVMRAQGRHFSVYDYRELYGNDEFFYDGPDYRIPVVCIGRSNFSRYHLDSDNVENCNFLKLEDSVELLKSFVRVFEADIVPNRQYRGPLYLSRYGISKDSKADKVPETAIDKIQILMDGKNSCLEIAEAINADFNFVYEFTQELIEKKLVKIKSPKAMSRYNKKEVSD